MQKNIPTCAVLAMLAAMLLLAAGQSFSATEKRHEPDRKAIELPDLEKDPGLFFLMGEQAEALGQTEAVLEYFRKALKLDPSSAYLNTRIANLLARNRKVAEALLMAQNATLLDPQYEEAYTLLGKIYTITGDRTKAIEAYNKALELKPDERDLYVFIGSLQASQKLFEDC